MNKAETDIEVKDFGILAKPISQEDLLKAAKEGQLVQGIVEIDETEIFGVDFEQVLDILSEKLTGTCMLSNIISTVVHPKDIELKDGYIYIQVCGDPEYAEEDIYGWDNEPGNETKANEVNYG